MNLLDENVREDQRSQLRTWGLPLQQIGSEMGRKGMKDEDRIGSWKLGATGNVNYRERPTAGTGPPGAGPPRTPRLKGTLPPAERARQAKSSGKSSGFFRILGEGGARQSKPAPRPRLQEKGIRDGEVIKDRFVGPLAWLVSRHVMGWVGRRAELGRPGGEAQVIENLPDDRWTLNHGDDFHRPAALGTEEGIIRMRSAEFGMRNERQ